MCSQPANRSDLFYSPGWQHDIVINGLIPGKRYYYKYGSNMTGIWSSWDWFQAPVLENEKSETHGKYFILLLFTKIYMKNIFLFTFD